MRGADLEAREAVECPFEDQMRQGDRGFERVADRVRQGPIPGQPARRFHFRGPGGGRKTSTPNRSHLAQNGWNFGWARSSPATLPATPMPRKPSVLTACSTCSAARPGYCNAAVAKATNRSGCEAQNSTRASFWTRINSATASRSARYQYG